LRTIAHRAMRSEAGITRGNAVQRPSERAVRSAGDARRAAVPAVAGSAVRGAPTLLGRIERSASAMRPGSCPSEGLLGLRHAVEEEVIDLLVLVVHRRGVCSGIGARSRAGPGRPLRPRREPLSSRAASDLSFGGVPKDGVAIRDTSACRSSRHGGSADGGAPPTAPRSPRVEGRSLPMHVFPLVPSAACRRGQRAHRRPWRLERPRPHALPDRVRGA
jgi:hypothetical protein